MASELVVPVVSLKNLREHPNASLLGLADVLGYQMVIPLAEDAAGTIVRRFKPDVRDERGQRIPADATDPAEDVKFRFKYVEEQLVVYFPADTLIPAEWADKFGVRKFLKGKDNDRVGRIRLRGEPSFGLVVEMPEGSTWKEGDNVADFYGAKKYEPPVRATCGDAASRDPLIDPFFDKFTDIQNGRIFVDVLKKGEEVIFTEKIHGTNCRVGIVDKKMVAGSMEVRRKRPFKKVDEVEVEYDFDSDEMRRSTYWSPWTINSVHALLSDTSLMGSPGNVILYGEVYGGSVQSLDYGIAKGKGIGFRAFGLKVDGKFLDWDEFEKVCAKYGVKTVPVLWRGPFSMAKAKELADGVSTMAGHIREGTVVYPVREREDPKVGRAVLKFIGTEYELSKHKDADTKDV
jgi:RNA ligase (TIGR02306 family)